MSRTEAARLVRERWERLGIGTPEEFPHVFSSDVDNMLASTGSILDVAPQQEHPTKAVTNESGTGVVANRKPLTNTNCDTNPISQNSITRGVAVSPAAPQDLDVADRATGNAPVTDGLQVGDEGVSPRGLMEKESVVWVDPTSVATGQKASPADSQFPTDDRYADNISRFVDSVFLAEQYRAEEGALIEASGYQDPGSDPRFA